MAWRGLHKTPLSFQNANGPKKVFLIVYYFPKLHTHIQGMDTTNEVPTKSQIAMRDAGMILTGYLISRSNSTGITERILQIEERLGSRLPFM